MTSRDEQRRKRRSDSFSRDEADEADNWLAGLRGSSRAEPDPFSGPPPEPFGGPPPMDRSGSFDRPGPLDRSGSFERPGPPDRSGSFDRPGPPEPPARAGGRRARAGDSPSGVFSPSALPPAPPPARPVLDEQFPDEPRGRRRARDDDSPSGTFGRAALPPARPPLDQQLPDEPRGRRRGGAPVDRRASESYDHGPELVPIIKPLAELTPPVVSAEPPPLVPIFPSRPDSSPTSGSPGMPTGRRARRAAEEEASTRTGEVGGRRRDRTGDDTGTRRGPAGGRPFADFAEEPASTRTGELGGRRRAGADDDVRAGGRRQRFPEGGPDTNGFEAGPDEAGVRRNGARPDATTAFRPGEGRNGYGAVPGDGRNGYGPARPGEGRNGFGPEGLDEVGGRRNGAARPDATTAFRPGEAAGRRRRPGYPDDGPEDMPGRPGDPAAFRRGEDTGARRQRPGFVEETGNTRPGEVGAPRRDRAGYDDEMAAYRRDDTGTARRTRAGFESAAPATEVEGPRRRDDTGVRRREEALRRHPAEEAPQQRRALDDAMPGRPSRFDDALYDDDPSAVRRRGDVRRGTGEYSGDYTTGGTRRALREPPGGRPAGPPGRPDRLDRPDRPDRADRADRLEAPRRPGRGGSGSHPKAVIDPVRPEHRPHRWVAMLSVIAIVLVLGACAIGTWFIFKDERNGPDSAKSSATAGPKKRDISSRQVDPNPLTEAEVFPTNNIVAVPNEPPYVILATKAATDCKVAATEQLATLLVNAGCTQVVRATMKSPTEDYLITAGIFNLDSEKTAKEAFDGVKPIVDGQKGRFAGMSIGAGTGTDALVRAPTQLGWNYKGHFIAYCVIARVDGNPFTPDDPYPNQITYDIVETYLENGIIETRAIIQPEATPAASLPASAPPS